MAAGRSLAAASSETQMTPTPPRLEAHGISKSFPGVLAVSNADLALMPGEIHALVGENGSGKSTLCMVFSGIYQPDAGDIFIDGTMARPENPRHAQALGISMMYQESNLVPQLTVAQNVALGHEPFLTRQAGLVESVATILRRLKFDIDPRTKAATLSGAQMQMVEIAKALYTRSKVIIMDEPTAALSALEVQRLHAVIRKIAASGVSIIYISHALEEALALADRVTVLRDGEVVACHPASELGRDDLVHLMVGRHVEIVRRPSSQARRGADLVRTEGLCWRERVRNVSFSLHAGEIVGLAGLIGSGRTEVASLLAGISRPDDGHIFVRGREVDLRSPRDALRHGIAILTENRKEEGLFLPLSVAHNLTISILSRLRGVSGLLSPAREQTEARGLADKSKLSAPSLQINVRSLSGGNQQKLLIGRMLAREPDILVFDEPTKGVDVGAIAEIHHLIRGLASRGKGILVISSYLPEIMALSDRILVMRGGEIVQDIDAAEATTDAVISRAFV